MGKSQSSADMVLAACNNIEHSSHNEQPNCIREAKALVAGTRLGIFEEYESNENGGNSFGLLIDDRSVGALDIDLRDIKPTELAISVDIALRRIGADPLSSFH